MMYDDVMSFPGRRDNDVMTWLGTWQDGFPGRYDGLHGSRTVVPGGRTGYIIDSLIIHTPILEGHNAAT